MPARVDRIARELNTQRHAFRAFLTKRLGSEAEAEDVLQNGLLKAVHRAGELQDDTKLSAWFYRILRNAVVDHYRNRGAQRRRDRTLGETLTALGEDVGPAPKDWDAQICACLGSVVDTLKPQHAELLRRVDLLGESVQVAASALEMTPNNASVTLHRARKDLRAKLESFCGACAEPIRPAGAPMGCRGSSRISGRKVRARASAGALG